MSVHLRKGNLVWADRKRKEKNMAGAYETKQYRNVFAAVAVVVGAIGILCDTKVITLGRIWSYVELGAFLAALFAFVSGMRKIKDKFFP